MAAKALAGAESTTTASARWLYKGGSRPPSRMIFPFLLALCLALLDCHSSWEANYPYGDSLPVVGATTMQRIRSMGGRRSRTLQPPRGASWKSSYFPRGRESRCGDEFGAHAPRGATTRRGPCASMEGLCALQSIRSWRSALVAVETLL